MAFASVYPLVTARSVARPFTYEVPDEVGPGAVVEVRFGNARRRGVVVEVGAVSAGRDRRGSDREGRGRGAGAARRARAVDRRVLRLDPGSGARADRAREARGVAPSGRSPPRGKRWAARRSRRRSASRRRLRSGGSSVRWTRGWARISFCTARPAAARRRSTSRRATRRSSGGWARSCSSPRSG